MHCDDSKWAKRAEEILEATGGHEGREPLAELALEDLVDNAQQLTSRAVVAGQRHGGRGRVVLGETQEEPDVRATERVDRLRVVADHGEAAAARLQRQQDRGLQAVGVLVFVDQHVAEASADLGGDLPHGASPHRESGGLRPAARRGVPRALPAWRRRGAIALSGDSGIGELREIVIFLSHYAGWPAGARAPAQPEGAALDAVEAGAALYDEKAADLK